LHFDALTRYLFFSFSFEPSSFFFFFSFLPFPFPFFCLAWLGSAGLERSSKRWRRAGGAEARSGEDAQARAVGAEQLCAGRGDGCGSARAAHPVKEREENERKKMNLRFDPLLFPFLPSFSVSLSFFLYFFLSFFSFFLSSFFFLLFLSFSFFFFFAVVRYSPVVVETSVDAPIFTSDRGARLESPSAPTMTFSRFHSAISEEGVCAPFGDRFLQNRAWSQH
jgi:hypothetical protein